MTLSPTESWDSYAKDLGIALQRARQRSGLSQEKVAHAAGISAYTYRKLEHGESNPGTPANPRLRTLAALAEILGVSLHDLVPSDVVGVADGRPHP